MTNLIYSRDRHPTIHIIGGGIMGLMAAIDLADEAKTQNLNISIRVYESGAFGGGSDHRATAPRSHLRLHSDGQLYVKDQPNVTLGLQQSTRRLARLAPRVFTGVFDDPPHSDPLALVFEPTDESNNPSLAEYYKPLGVWYEPVHPSVAKRWFPECRLEAIQQIYRVRDTTIDLNSLSASLVAQASSRGVELLLQDIHAIDLRGEIIHSLITTESDRIRLSQDDQIVLACGPSIRPLLSSGGIKVPGLRLFLSQSVATSAFGLPIIAIVHNHEGVNCTPHGRLNGVMVNVFGNTNRVEVNPEDDNQLLHVDPNVVKGICRNVEEWFGLRLPPESYVAWPAVKTEMVPDGEARSQAFHTSQLSELANAWIAIPGKLSQTAACSLVLARKVCQTVGQRFDKPIASPVWDERTIEIARRN